MKRTKLNRDFEQAKTGGMAGFMTMAPTVKKPKKSAKKPNTWRGKG